MGHIYYGSNVSGLTRIEPHKSIYGNYVCATDDKVLATIFSGRAGDDLTYSVFRTVKDGPWYLVERIPCGFSAMFDNGASIYTLDDEDFKSIKPDFSKMVSDTAVDVIDEEKIEEVSEKLIEFNKDGLIKICRYPERPSNVPMDDTDLIEIELTRLEKENRTINRESFERLLFLHPKLLNKVNSIACSMNEDFVPFKKEDLIDVFEKFLLLQMIEPTKEYFLKSAVISMSLIYPEFYPLLDEKLEILDKTKEEKIVFLIDEFSKEIRNIPIELIEQGKERYLNDERSFCEIGREIMGIYRKVSSMEKLVNKPVDDEVFEKSVILIGPMGVGKSTIGRMIAHDTNMPHISLDNRGQLANLYQYWDNFRNFKDFEFFLTGTVLTSLQEPTVIDFGAGHSVYDDPIMFLEMKSLMRKFKNVVLLIPSDDKEESLSILNQRKGIEDGNSRARDNNHFVNSPCNYDLATSIKYTKDKNSTDVAVELLETLGRKSQEAISNIQK